MSAHGDARMASSDQPKALNVGNPSSQLAGQANKKAPIDNATKSIAFLGAEDP